MDWKKLLISFMVGIAVLVALGLLITFLWYSGEYYGTKGFVAAGAFLVASCVTWAMYTTEE